MIAVAARRARSLSPSGARAAVVVGTVSVAAGWSWGVLLVLFFAASTGLSRLGRRSKEARTGGVVEKGGERDAAQVLANGGIFGTAALLSLVAPGPAWLPVGAGALAAATADTWATEIGTLARQPPRSIVTLRPVAPGMSGGVTVAGTLASLAGATLIAAAAFALGWPAAVAAAALVGGVLGATADSVLGATLQVRRWCDRCDAGTERRVHTCGATTRRSGGLARLDNDGVNLVSGLVGALTAVLAWVAFA